MADFSRSPAKVYKNFNQEKNKMTHQNNDSRLDAVMELLIENGFDGFADVLRILLNEAMRIERKTPLLPGLTRGRRIAKVTPTDTSQNRSATEAPKPLLSTCFHQPTEKMAEAYDRVNQQ